MPAKNGNLAEDYPSIHIGLSGGPEPSQPRLNPGAPHHYQGLASAGPIACCIDLGFSPCRSRDRLKPRFPRNRRFGRLKPGPDTSLKAFVSQTFVPSVSSVLKIFFGRSKGALHPMIAHPGQMKAEWGTPCACAEFRAKCQKPRANGRMRYDGDSHL